MSNIYIQEPPTHGKVLLETTVGDLEIELWARECPKASRNFVQLCIENYYAKTKFHRVIKDFIVQGGDPTGTGNGGESIYGKPFKDEFHSRLRFCRRGLVAMANSGKDDNGSQFFITMGPTQELQNKHTIFGKVAGDTVYNMLRLQEGAVNEETERPEHPHKILKTKVLINPFDDIVPRETIQLLDEPEKKAKKSKSKMKATKDYKLLSFGDEAEGDEDDLDSAIKSGKGGPKSAHDLLKDPKLSSDVGEEFRDLKRKRSGSESEPEPEERWEAKTSEERVSSVRDKLKKKAPKVKEPKKAEKEGSGSSSDSDDTKEQKKKREAIKKEIRELQKEMRRGEEKQKAAKVDEDDSKEPELTKAEEANDMLRQYHEEQRKYSNLKPKKNPKKGSSAREKQALDILAKFTAKLENASKGEKVAAAADDDDDDFNGDDWMANTLNFENHDPVLAKDANTKGDDWFDIYDPRNPLNKRRRERDRKK